MSKVVAALPDETTRKGRKKKEQAVMSMADLEKMYAVEATEAAAAAPIGTGAPRISTKSETFSLGDRILPDPLELIVIAQAHLNVWYDTAYDPDDRQPPGCFALAPVKEFDAEMKVKPGTGEEAMHAHETSPNKQGGVREHDCVSCPKNQFGSAEIGKGKACANTIQLAIAFADDPALTGNEGELRYGILGLSATALGPWGKYVKALAEIVKRPPHGVVTQFSFNKKDKDERRRKAVVAIGHKLISDPRVALKIKAVRQEILTSKVLLRPLPISAPDKEPHATRAKQTRLKGTRREKAAARPAARF